MILAPVLAFASAIALVVPSAAATASSTPRQRQHTVETFAFVGDQFRCGTVLLTATGGTYTETTDGTLKDGVVHVRIVRTYDDLTLSGSDGRPYTADAFAHQLAILIAPDFDNPVFSIEVNDIKFSGGPTGIPGRIHEVLKTSHGSTTDRTTGGCTAGT
jgi:hypothetical protein